MNTNFLASPRLAAAIALGLGQASLGFSQEEMPDHSHHDHHHHHHDHAQVAGHVHGSAARADSHAPIGVMGDHAHGEGGWMFAYRRMQMRMEGHRRGSRDLSSEEVFALGFDAAAESMDMGMDMFELMYAPSDAVTLMLMTHRVELDMKMAVNPRAGHGGHGGHGGHASGGSHGTSGWGDTSLSAILRGWEALGGQLNWTIGVSAPTGSVDESMGGAYQSYGMQLGSGTWDARLGATYSGFAERFSWGAQAAVVTRLQESGPSGYSRGDVFEATAWGAWLIAPSLSVSGRLAYSSEGNIEGHFDGPHNHAAPTDFQENYGGDILEAHVGANWVFASGALQGHRLALELGAPIAQQLNGVGMKREAAATLAWQLAW